MQSADSSTPFLAADTGRPDPLRVVVRGVFRSGRCTGVASRSPAGAWPGLTLPCPSGWAEASLVQLTFAGQPSTAVGYLGRPGGRALPGGTPGHEGDGGPGDQRLGVSDEPLIVPRVAAGVHHPRGRPLDDSPAGQRDEAGGALGTTGWLDRELEALLRPVDELSGVGGVGPHDRDLGVHQAKPEEDFKRLQYRPDTRDGFMAGTGLTLDTPTSP